MRIFFSALVKSLALALLLSPFMLGYTFANEGAKAAGGPAPMKFVVNLGNPALDGRMLSVEMVLEGAPLEVAAGINTYRPKIQHEIILLLTSENANNLRTADGKRGLGEKIKDVVNKILKETDRTGVKEVLFVNFMIQ